MELEIDHPAIVHGTWEFGAPRKELVTVRSKFTLEERSNAELVPFINVIEKGRQPYVIYGHEGYAYRRISEADPQTLFKGRGGHNFTTELPGLPSYLRKVMAALRIEDQPEKGPGHRVENARKPVTKGEQARGMTPMIKAILEAPKLKNWKWLAHDVDMDVEAWRGRLASHLSNFLVVDGALYGRCFEPCFVMTKLHGGVWKYYLDSSPPYAHEVGDATNPPQRAESYQNIAEFYFALDELDDIAATAEAAGIELQDPASKIEILTDERPKADFFDAEVLRHWEILESYAANWKVGGLDQKIATVMGGMPITSKGSREFTSAALSRYDDISAALLDWPDDAGVIQAKRRENALTAMTMLAARADIRPINLVERAEITFGKAPFPR